MEEKRNQKTELKTGHKKASKVIFVLGVLLAVAIIFACVTSIVLLFFSVEEIEVVGDSRYNYSDIIEASGIKQGKRLYYLNESKAESARIEA